MEDVSTLAYEEAMEELAQLTQRLERGQVPLAEALTLYQRAQALMKHTDALLAPLRQTP